MKKFIFLFLVLALASTCGSPVASPMPSPAEASPLLPPTATFTQEPTATSTSFPTPTTTRTPIPSRTPLPEPLLTLKLLSYNILFGAGVDPKYYKALETHIKDGDIKQKYRLPELVSYLKRTNADIIGIQEAAGWLGGNPPIVQKVANELEMNYYLAEAPSGLHVVVLTRYKIIEAENLSLKIGNVGALRATLQSPLGFPINVFVVHLNPYQTDFTICQAGFLSQLVQPYLNQLTIVMGDMNFVAQSEGSAKLQRGGLQRLTAQMRFMMGIDQIWISRDIKRYPTNWFTHLELPYGLSDHLPIGIEIKILPPLPTSSSLGTTSTVVALGSSPLLDKFFTEAKILDVDKFDSSVKCHRWVTYQSRYVEFTNNLLKIKGAEYWAAGIERLGKFNQGKGVFLRFRFTKGTEAELFLDSDSWGAPSYRRFGIYIRDSSIQTNLFQGKAGIGGQTLAHLKPNRWYYLILAIDEEGNFVEFVVDPHDLGHPIKYQRRLGASWNGLDWRFAIGANRGELSIDDFYEFSFGDLK